MTIIPYGPGEAMEEILSRINEKLPENPTADQLDQAISEVEAEQKARHARELAELERAHQARMRQLNRRSLARAVVLLLAGAVYGTVLFYLLEAITR